MSGCRRCFRRSVVHAPRAFETCCRPDVALALGTRGRGVRWGVGRGGQEIVYHMLLDDGCLGRGQRANLLNHDFRFGGVAFGSHPSRETAMGPAQQRTACADGFFVESVCAARVVSTACAQGDSCKFETVCTAGAIPWTAHGRRRSHRRRPSANLDRWGHCSVWCRRYPKKDDKLKVCHVFERTGKCANGARCRFSHAVVSKACGADGLQRVSRWFPDSWVYSREFPDGIQHGFQMDFGHIWSPG